MNLRATCRIPQRGVPEWRCVEFFFLFFFLPLLALYVWVSRGEGSGGLVDVFMRSKHAKGSKECVFIRTKTQCLELVLER